MTRVRYLIVVAVVAFGCGDAATTVATPAPSGDEAPEVTPSTVVLRPNAIIPSNSPELEVRTTDLSNAAPPSGRPGIAIRHIVPLGWSVGTSPASYARRATADDHTLLFQGLGSTGADGLLQVLAERAQDEGVQLESIVVGTITWEVHRFLLETGELLTVAIRQLPEIAEAAVVSIASPPIDHQELVANLLFPAVQVFAVLAV